MPIRTTSIVPPRTNLAALFRSASEGKASVKALLDNEDGLREVLESKGLPATTLDDYLELAAIRAGIPTA